MGEKTVLITVRLPRGLLEGLGDLVERGLYPNRSEAVRAAIMELLERHRDGLLRPEGEQHDGKDPNCQSRGGRAQGQEGI
ncbi:MAG: ribbon-helix-helix domain-containing protein [Thermoproteus sp.]